MPDENNDGLTDRARLHNRSFKVGQRRDFRQVRVNGQKSQSEFETAQSRRGNGSMRDIVITLIVIGSLPFILSRPYFGVLVWSWIAFMNPHRLAWGFAYSWPFAAIAGGVTIVAYLFSKEPKRLPWCRELVVFLLFILWMNITTLFALSPDNAWPQWNKVMKIQLMVLVALAMLNNKERIHGLIWVVALSIGFFGIKGGIFTILTGGDYLVWGPPGSFFGGNNELALALIMVMPLFRYLQTIDKRKWVKWGLGIAMILMAISIISSYSRGAFLAIIAMGIFLAMKSRKKVLLGAIIIAAIPIAFVAMPGKWTERMESIQHYEQDGSAMGRINAWGFALNLANDRPLVGGGFETFRPDLFRIYAPDPYDWHDAHSIWFEILGEHGYVGLALFLLLGLLTYRTGSWLIKNAKSREHTMWAADLAAMVQVSIVGYAVGGTFLGLAYFDLYYNLIIFLIASRALVTVELNKAEAADKKQPEQYTSAYNIVIKESRSE